MNENMKKVLKEVYDDEGEGSRFKRDYKYLEGAYSEIESLWKEQLERIVFVRFVMLAEAPLWGKAQKYFYNEETPQSQFFYYSDLKRLVNREIRSKKDMIDCFGRLGIIVVDILPFPLAPDETALSYGKRNGSRSKRISSDNYKKLIEKTFPYHLYAAS